MDKSEILAFSEQFLAAWNTQDVERVVAGYTDDVVYRDPNTRGEVHGADALRHYVRKLLAAWDMHWTLRDAYPFADGTGAAEDGAAVLWHASFRKPNGAQTVEADGMDLVLLRGNRIHRNEVYFDRIALAPLIETH